MIVIKHVGDNQCVYCLMPNGWYMVGTSDYLLFGEFNKASIVFESNFSIWKHRPANLFLKGDIRDHMSDQDLTQIMLSAEPIGIYRINGGTKQ